MKALTSLLLLCVIFASCKSTYYNAALTPITQTQVELSQANFNTLGTFSGLASEKTYNLGIKNAEGVVSQAKKKMLENAKAAGVELVGSRALVNVSIDVIQNENRVTVTYNATIIEFK